MIKIWLIQSVLSPYRIPLFKELAEAEGVDFKLILLSSQFKTRPQWKRNLHDLPFQVDLPFGISYQTNAEKQYCLNPFLLFKLLRERPDVVICGGYSPATLMIFLGSLMSRTKFVIWTEATMSTDGAVQGLRLGLRRLLARRAAAFVDAGSQAQEYVEYLLPGISPERSFRAYNCVNNRDFILAEKPDSTFFAQRSLPKKNLVFVGKLNQRKGIPQLLQVYKKVVSNAKEEVGLILIGEGELREDVEEFKREHSLKNIRLEGWLKNEEIARYYASADIFILLSVLDQNPLVIFEALGSGIPIICSNRAGNASDFIKQGVNGYIVDPTDLDDVVRRVEEVLAWDTTRRAVCECFSKEVVQKANYPDAAKAFLDACRYAMRSGNDNWRSVEAKNPAHQSSRLNSEPSNGISRMKQ